MSVPSVQFACGTFAVATPLLLIAGYYSQLLLDRLAERRDQLLLAIVSVAALVGEVAALTGVVRPHRLLEAIAALCTAVSGTGVLLTVGYLLRLRARLRPGPGRRQPRP